MRFILCSLAVLGLAACDASIPDSNPGVGFDSYADQRQKQAARDVALAGQGQPLAAPMAVSEEQLGYTSTNSATSYGTEETEAERLAAATAAALNSGEQPIDATPLNPAPQVALGPSGISTENDFEDVSTLRSIESDAQKIEQNRAQYEVVQPTDLPTRPGNTGPNIVNYALSTTNPVGQQMYSRFAASEGRAKRNCAKYMSPDQAQAAFLQKGGPQKDRLGVDPDGDGYACSWNPAPFRKVSGG
ncbi:hypothetical protein TG4357_01098 [Thalassovita gelatinovora]|uniref:Excalibur calcium-binding domain-containing protein n=1 Tax=Thalassovita gelatinovora TaxID=53501 RepID=A0A0P1F7X5_THAGE|nr:hypothetical protein [Thalassovita gelatinovora]QIZ80261.1 hypothetical protein HFZ77_07145 [Thalassovita gelatinovora]CUH64133.1 hypothetical protein TG4357_01098 [Thalassovita gelatinovora]SEQ84130.1 hypothetical protein SAMN04488043_109140 [Thalassovita gelatinovora]